MVTNNSTVYNFYGIFCAGAVCISIPLSILFIFTQKYYVAGITGGAVKG
jgi:arabinogalactan oligomer/maltooligosaccharide transport system permease protein